MISATRRGAPIALMTALLAQLLGSPAPARAADAAQPALTAAEERALGDDLLFCTSLLNFTAMALPDGAERQRWEDERGLVFMMAATLIPDDALKDRVTASLARFNAWLGTPPSVDEMRERFADCKKKRSANRTWILARRQAADQAAPGTSTSPAFTWGGQPFLHRWSRAGLHEFTPPDQEDLQRWTRMVTITVHEQVTDGDGLAALANGLLASYQRAGKVLRTTSKPRSAIAPAEHFIAAILAANGSVECVFARLRLHEGRGVVVISSFRKYGPDAAREAASWLSEHGPAEEDALMSWDGLPPLAALRAYPDAAE